MVNFVHFRMIRMMICLKSSYRDLKKGQKKARKIFPCFLNCVKFTYMSFRYFKRRGLSSPKRFFLFSSYSE